MTLTIAAKITIQPHSQNLRAVSILTMVVYEGRGKAQHSVTNPQEQSHHHDLQAQVENSLAGTIEQLDRDRLFRLS